jgi:hypothetical protein
VGSPFPPTISFGYAAVAGSASEGVDFQAASGTLTFGPGQTSVVVDIPILGDRVFESDETFSVILENVIGGKVSDGSALVTILTMNHRLASVMLK